MEILGSLEAENIPKTTVHYNRALKALVVGKQHGQLQGVLDQMAASGAVWDDTTVKLLVNNYVEQGDMAKVGFHACAYAHTPVDRHLSSPLLCLSLRCVTGGSAHIVGWRHTACVLLPKLRGWPTLMLTIKHSLCGNQQAIDAFERAREEELIGAVDPALYDAVLGCYRKTGAMEKVRAQMHAKPYMHAWSAA